MIMKRRHGGLLVSLTQQITMSVLATVAASALIGEARRALDGPHPLPIGFGGALPSLTTGGKFAMRVLDGLEAGRQSVTLIDLPPILPMFTAAAVPPLDTAGETVPSTGANTRIAVARIDPPTGMQAAARRPGRRIAVAGPPARKSSAAVRMAALPDLPPTPTPPPPSFLERSRAAYAEFASWGDAVWDRLSPL